MLLPLLSLCHTGAFKESWPTAYRPLFILFVKTDREHEQEGSIHALQA